MNEYFLITVNYKPIGEQKVEDGREILMEIDGRFIPVQTEVNTAC
jgi:hypothetical protein